MQFIKRYGLTIVLTLIAIFMAQWIWHYYMAAPWTRDGKINADIVSISSDIAGKVTEVRVKDNQLVKRGDILFVIDPQPYQIALEQAKASLQRATAEQIKAEHIAKRRRNMPSGTIPAESIDDAINDALAAKAAVAEAQSAVDHATWSLERSQVVAPTDGYVTNLKVRQGHYTQVGESLVALVDSESFYVTGYFEETKLSHIQVNDTAKITLYSNDETLTGVVESIGRAIADQSVDSASSLIPSVKTNVPWIRLAQRVPVRIKLNTLPAHALLVVGTSCTVVVTPQ